MESPVERFCAVSAEKKKDESQLLTITARKENSHCTHTPCVTFYRAYKISSSGVTFIPACWTFSFYHVLLIYMFSQLVTTEL